MDIFSALQTSVSGLQAQSYAIANISGNIANSQTTGFKRIDTSFIDLMAEQTPKREVSGTVLAQAQLTNTIQGNVISSQVATNMAINGQGFFTVAQKTSDAGGQPVISGQTTYTRRGDFAPDKDGYLVNGAGDYLLGQNIDPTTGQASTTGLIKISNSNLPAQPTKTINYAANLPATPITSSSPTTGSDLYTPAVASSVVTPAAPGPATQVGVADAPNFVSNSIAGPTVTAYTTSGAPVTVATRWAKVQDASAADPTSVWNLYYQADTTTTATNSAWTNVGSPFVFSSAGQLQSPVGGTTINALTVSGTNLGNVKLNIGAGALTAYADTTGAATTNTLTQDGYTSGTLKNVAVGQDGTINGTYSNGSVLTLANVGFARFNNPNGLKADSFGHYYQTVDSGSPLQGLAGATIVGESNEQSNTDIATEFSKMIVTQQAYSANTRVMSTAQTMMTDLLNVIR
ncbi:flagellar hook protein FlgE [Methylobacterium aerolatum]|uniref:Flagellar hook protein FlgE n=1 Tax=Methylobacterium aerolatum TaxID=418708 RepID=A0ABU0HZB0_9HYPH|nr:flagellar hook-basal body complex protein [Methylobacterium aerolatum]MDQ0447684.1 flagellar hook protein FlgE [Methylobacterium aerolatum]GJD34784.1 Flagellar hook protein FlgE [Methylobacterium aerolatum]